MFAWMMDSQNARQRTRWAKDYGGPLYKLINPQLDFTEPDPVNAFSG